MTIPVRRFYEFGRFRLDPAEYQLVCNEQPVVLSPKTFAMLVVLVSNSGRLLTKEELIRAVWADTVVEENNLDKTISLLRKALDESGGDRNLIETVRGRGYRFRAQVTLVESSAATNELRCVGTKPPALPANERPIVTAQPEPASPAPRQSRILVFKLSMLCLSLLLAVAWLWLWQRKSQSGGKSSGISVMRLNNDSAPFNATLSPDGKYFAYVRYEGERNSLWLRPIAGGEPLELAPATEQQIWGTTFTPDGQFVYFTVVDRRDAQGALYRVPVLGGARTKLLTRIASPVSFSPDGRQMAFTRYGDDGKVRELIITGSDGESEHTLLTSHDPEWLTTYGAGWSPDGREIACQVESAATLSTPTTCRIVGVDVRNGGRRPLTSNEWEGCGRICWLPDGRGFALIGTRLRESGITTRDQVWYVSQPDGAVRRITDGLSRHLYGSLGISGDGQSLLAVQFDYISQVWSVVADRRSGQLRYVAGSAAQLTTGTNEGRTGITSLTGGRIVFTAQTGKHVELRQIAPDGRQHGQMATIPTFLEEVSAPADGRFFVFSSLGSDRRSHLFRMDADGSNLRQLTSGESYEVDSDCSSDGQWIVYALQPITPGSLGTVQIWKVPAEGGTPIQLTNGEADVPRLSPDGKWVSYICPADPQKTTWRVEVISAAAPEAKSAEKSPPVKRFNLPPASVLNEGCRWTPDGQSLTYIVKGEKFSNLWAQPLNGDPPHPLTDFASGHIYNYAFARDGRHLYLARGYPTQDALLIRDFR